MNKLMYMLSVSIWLFILLLALSRCSEPYSYSQAGEPGPVGPAGQGCSVEQTAAGATITCGDTLVTISNGSIGPQGNPGMDATPTTVIQFCSKQDDTIYPSNFPEQGLCINHNLYGVYWDGKNAWLAEIVPGSYLSTATGLGCTFTVSKDCVVSP